MEWSEDLDRILALPRRPIPHFASVVGEMTLKLRRPHGTQLLREHQAWALWEAPKVGGLFAQLAVGSGKTLCGLLMPMVMSNCKRAVLLIPPSLRPQLLEHDWEFYGKHWRLPNLAGGKTFVPGLPVLHVVAYSELSSTKSTLLLEHIKPDLIIGDEVHNLKHYSSSKTKRFLHFLASHPETKFCGWSGTVTSRGLRDYAHLVAIALNEGSPLPIEARVVEEWALALDPNDSHFDEGMLSALCIPGEEVRHGFRRRLVDTPGVVATAEDALGTSLVFYRRDIKEVPENILGHLRALRRRPEAGGWKRPDGEELVSAMQVNACARELAMGFWYRWRFPRQEPLEQRLAWFARRQEWNRELREKLKNSTPHLESPALCENAAKRWYDGGCPGCARGPLEGHGRGCKVVASHPLWDSYTYPAWRAIEDTIEHEQETVWEHDFLLKDAAAWMKENVGIVWVEHAAVGHALAKISGSPYYGAGKAAHSEIIKETGKRSIICGESHSVGKNLQNQFHRALVLSPSPDAQLLEQTIGRIHRPGQPEDTVEVFFYLHTPELKDALEVARRRAKYVVETTGSPQKLDYGAWSFDVSPKL